MVQGVAQAQGQGGTVASLVIKDNLVKTEAMSITGGLTKNSIDLEYDLQLCVSDKGGDNLKFVTADAFVNDGYYYYSFPNSSTLEAVGDYRVKVFANSYNADQPVSSSDQGSCDDTRLDVVYDDTIYYNGDSVTNIEINGTADYAGGFEYHAILQDGPGGTDTSLDSTEAKIVWDDSEYIGSDSPVINGSICVDGESQGEDFSGSMTFTVPAGVRTIQGVAVSGGQCSTLTGSFSTGTPLSTAESFTTNFEGGKMYRLDLVSKKHLANILDINTTNSVSQSPSIDTPNLGDINNDGIADTIQSNVVALSHGEGEYTGLEVDCEGCILLSSSAASIEDFDTQTLLDEGVVSFELEADSADVTLYFYTDNTSVQPAKFNTDTGVATPIEDAVVEAITIDGQSVVKVSNPIVDGGDLDQDGSVNGRIVDPVGLMADNALIRTGGF